MADTGFFSAVRSRLERNRLGELLVQRGKLTPEQLRTALRTQKETGVHLGRVLRDLDYVTSSQIRTTLFEQAGYRALAASFTLFIGVSAFIFSGRTNSFNDLKPSAPADQQTMVYKAAYHPQDLPAVAPAPSVNVPFAHPNLFGSREVASKDISAFKKWTDIVGRLDNISFRSDQIDQFRDMSITGKVVAVNEYVNNTKYIEDKDNYGKSDYWATPAEFFARGGDCEDYAIAKYAMLKRLGIAEENMRLAIVTDTLKNIPHALLIVYTDNGAMILDNQTKTAKDMTTVTRYKPIYSINSTGWWRHLG